MQVVKKWFNPDEAESEMVVVVVVVVVVDDDDDDEIPLSGSSVSSLEAVESAKVKDSSQFLHYTAQ